MATRLLALLNKVEEAFLEKSTSQLGLSWSVKRMVNYHHGLARLTLTPPPEANPVQLRGAVFLQSCVLADGTLWLKASFNWHGSDAFPSLLIVSKPLVDWQAEATRIASFWLAGPNAASATPPTPKTPPLFEKAS